MDYDAQHRKRVEELENKRKRLEEMRKMRKDRAGGDAATTGATAAPSSAAAAESNSLAPAPSAATASSADSRADIDALVNSLLVADISDKAGANQTASQTATAVKAVASPVTSDTMVSREEIVRAKAAALVSSTRLASVHIMPAVRETYDKACQTEEPEEPDSATPSTPEATASSRRPRIDSTAERGARSLAIPELPGSPLPGANISAAFDLPGGLGAAQPAKPTALSADEQRELMASASFQSFLDQSSRVVERVLAQVEGAEADYMRDYKRGSVSAVSGAENKGIHLIRTMSDPKLAHRPVMDVQQCPHYPELFLAAYGSVGQTVQQRDQWGVFTNPALAASQPGSAAGVVCVWSLAVPTRPEFTFTATSPVLSALFHTHDQHLVIGGCYSGQILLWDMRAKSLPVQRSNLAGRGHKHPVFCMADADPAGAASSSTGTGSHEIISAGTDGMVCQWDLSRLSDPISTSCVSFPARPDGSVAGGNGVTIDASAPSMKSANISCMAFGGRADGPRDLFLGTDMGRLVKTPVPIRANDPASQQFDAHLGLVTSISPHNSNSKLFKNLFLTSSLDWTVKLWNSAQSMEEPILQFFSPTYDYVCGAQWSPSNSSLFGTISSTGSVNLWNMSKSVLEPSETFHINSKAPATGTGGKGASTAASLNKFSWLRDGRKMVVGDSAGSLHLLGVQDAAADAKLGDEAKFEHVLYSSRKTGVQSS